ncbi:phosphatase PAP2 family protein [Mycobacterium sp.]|uniref:phosphatase PAP2 family protein n=1 Tax=Mycobacterium sp. TaxID=1785 RepID=UPI0026287E13|nr:phosphatase PAP2 family protein [Mycobacterium sp.]
MTRPKASPAVGIAVLAAAVYALMWVGYRQHWNWLYRVDWSLLNGAHAAAIKHPSWLRLAESVSFVLGPGPLAVLGIAATVFALAMRRLRAALVLLLACAPCNELVTAAAKAMADRPRPPTMLVAAASTSFPSGHALEATAGLLAMLSFVLPMANRAARRIAVVAVALALPAVGISRVALNVHYPSDVLAGWSLGYLYFLLCLWVFHPPIGQSASIGDAAEPAAAR